MGKIPKGKTLSPFGCKKQEFCFLAVCVFLLWDQGGIRHTVPRTNIRLRIRLSTYVLFWNTDVFLLRSVEMSMQQGYKNALMSVIQTSYRPANWHRAWDLLVDDHINMPQPIS